MLVHSVTPCSNIQSSHAQTFCYAMLIHSVMPCYNIELCHAQTYVQPCCCPAALSQLLLSCAGAAWGPLDCSFTTSIGELQIKRVINTPQLLPPRLLGTVTEANQVRSSVLQARLVTVRAQMLPVDLKHLSLYGIACCMWFSYMQLVHS